MKRTPFTHQKNALAYAAGEKCPALFMEMRLGKTLVAIHDAIRKGCRRILIVCPKAVMGTWAEELQADGERCITPIIGTRKQRLATAAMVARRRAWFIVGYEALRETPELAGVHWSPARRLFDGGGDSIQWDAVILDESTTIRNPQAAVTKVCTKGFRDVTHRYALTGLPNPESPQDFFAQCQFLYGGMMGHRNFWTWRKAHFAQVGHDWFAKKETRKAIRQWVHDRAFRLTRKMAGLGNRKVYQRRRVQMTKQQQDAYAELRDDLIMYSPERRLAKHTIQKLGWLHQMSGGFNPDGTQLGGGKLEELRTLVTGELADQPVLVWFRYNQELKAAQAVLKKAGVSTGVIDGSTKNRDRVRRKFMDGDTRVLLLQTRAAYFGLNLSRASTAIYYSNYFDAEIRAQSEDRLAHPKKKEPLLYIDLMTDGGMCEDVLMALKDKQVEAADYTRRVWERLCAAA